MPDPISRLYDAAMGEDSWDDAVGAIAGKVGAEVFILGMGNPRDPNDLELWSANWDTSQVLDAGYTLGDVWNPMVNPDVAAGLIMPIGRTVHCRQMVPEDTYRTSDFLQATVAKSGYRDYRLHVPLRDSEALAGGFMAKGPGRDFDRDEVAELDWALPHLGRALKLRSQINRHRNTARNLAAVLEALSYGVMLLDRGGEVILTNARCETMLARNDGLSVVRKVPKLGADADAAVAAALRVIDLGGSSFPAVEGVPIPRGADLPPYLLRIYPGLGFASFGGVGEVGAVLLIDDPLDPEVLPNPQLLHALFGLSPAEAAVAQLVPRLTSRRAIAERLGLSENTVKTHLVTIREKVGARTTSELSQILVRATLGQAR